MIRYLLLFLLTASTAFAGESRIYAQRVQVNGAILGSPIIVYNSASGPQSMPRVAFNDGGASDGRFLVIWNEWNGDDLDVKAARIEMDGIVVDTTPIDVASGSRTQAIPDVAPSSTGWMAVWHGFDGTDVFPSLFAQKIEYNGSTVGTPLQFGDSYDVGSEPRIAYDSVSDKYLVAYTTLPSSSSNGHIVRWLTLSTTPEDTYTAHFITPTTNDFDYSIASAPGGGWTMVGTGGPPNYWGRTSTGAFAAHIENTGLLNTSGYIANGHNLAYIKTNYSTDLLDNNNWVYGRTAVVEDSAYLVGVWPRHSQGGVTGYALLNADLYAATIDDYDRVEAIGGTVVANSASIEDGPSLAGDGAGNLLLVYDKDTDGSIEIASKILTVSGTSITPSSEVIIQTDTTGGRRSQSVVAYGDDGTTEEFLVVWTEGWWGVYQ